MVRKKYRQMTAIVMAAVLCSSTLTVHGSQMEAEPVEDALIETASEEVVESEVEGVSETEIPLEETAVEETEVEEEAEETEVEEEAEVEETETEEETKAEEVEAEEVEAEEVEAEEVEAEEVEAEEVEAEEVEAEEVEAEEVETEEETEAEEVEVEEETEGVEAEEETEVEEAETQQERIFQMEVRDAAGNVLQVQKMTTPDSLTCNGATYPADYMDGVYRVQVPSGTESLQFSITQPEGATNAELTKWNGYLVETEGSWLLCPDVPIANAFLAEGNVYTAFLEHYEIEMETISMEQLAVYGTLNDAYSYAEVFLSSPDLSAVVLVEMQQEAEEETEMEENGEELAEEPLDGEEVPDGEKILEEEAAAQSEDKEESPEELSEETEEGVLLEATAKEINKASEKTGKSLANSADVYVPQVSSINGEWQILGLVRSEQAVSAGLYEKYLQNVVNTLKEKNGVLHKKKYTEYSRVVLALTALGEDVTNVGGYNLLEPLADFEQTVWQGVNGAIFALLAFDSHDYEIPQVEAGKEQTTRVKLLNHILSLEVSGGGWTLSGSTADPDMTGMAIQALAPYYNTNTAVKSAVDRALNKLSSLQNRDGGFGSYGVANSESCAQVIVALTALGIDPNTDSRFIKNGKSVVDALLSFANSDGSFQHEASGGADQMSTEQAYYALTSYQRLKDGQTSLYDMSDVALQSDRDKAAKVVELIAALPAEITEEQKTQVETVLSAYNYLTSLQKSLVPSASYEKLQAAIEALQKRDVEVEVQTPPAPETPEDDTTTADGTTDREETNSNTQTGTSTSTGSTSKNPSGGTKQVNLVSSSSSSNRTGSTSSTESSSSGKSSSKKEKEETEKETEETEKKDSDKKTGSTKISDAAKAVITDINSLFRTTKAGKKLPNDAADYTDTQIAAILNIYRSYEALSSEDKKLVEKNAKYNKYVEVLGKMKEENHYDEPTGTDLRENEEEILPWYVAMEVLTQLPEEAQMEQVRTALKNQGELFTMQDIHLLDQKDGGEWHPQDLVKVSIPMTDLGEYESVAVVHMKDDGSIEFLKAHISGSQLEFSTDTFSKFGIVGFHGSMENLMEEQEQEPIWMYLIPGIAAALLLCVMFLLRMAGWKGKKGGKE